MDGKILGHHNSRMKGVIYMRPTRLITILVALVVTCFTFAATASAEMQISPVQNGVSTFNLAVTNSSSSSLQGSATLNGKLEIKAQQPSLQHKLKTHKEHGLVCRTGIAIWGASETSNGTVWIPKPGNHGKTHACLVHGIWRQILGPPSQWNCGNQIVWMHEKLPKEAVKFTGKFVIVTHFVYTVTVNVTAEAKQEGTATATCTLPGVTASSTVHAIGVATGNATGTEQGSSQAEATAKAKSEAEGIVGSHSSETALFASAQANASVKLEGQATAYCSEVKPPPPTPNCEELKNCQKEEKCLPPTVEVAPHNCKLPPEIKPELIQEVYPNGTRTICATVRGENITTVEFFALYGTFTGPVYKKEGNLYCAPYKAPSAVPAGKHDPIEYFAEEENNSQLVSFAFEEVEIREPELKEPPR